MDYCHKYKLLHFINCRKGNCLSIGLSNSTRTLWFCAFEYKMTLFISNSVTHRCTILSERRRRTCMTINSKVSIHTSLLSKFNNINVQLNVHVYHLAWKKYINLEKNQECIDWLSHVTQIQGSTPTLPLLNANFRQQI